MNKRTNMYKLDTKRTKGKFYLILMRKYQENSIGELLAERLHSENISRRKVRLDNGNGTRGTDKNIVKIYGNGCYLFSFSVNITSFAF